MVGLPCNWNAFFSDISIFLFTSLENAIFFLYEVILNNAQQLLGRPLNTSTSLYHFHKYVNECLNQHF